MFGERERNETRESVTHPFKQFTDEAAALQTNNDEFLSVMLKNLCNLEVIIKMDTELSMLDGKMMDLLQGDSGTVAFAIYAEPQDMMLMI